MQFDLSGSKVIDGLGNVGDFFSHRLADHPLLQMDEIRKLVKRIPKNGLFYSAGIKPESAIIGDWHTHPGKHPLDFAIDNMENADAYMYILGPEVDPGFRPLYVELKADLDEFCRRNSYRLTDSRLALFISSPGAIAPHHIDEQHTFIAQIKGSKTMFQWPAGNHELTTAQELEAFFGKVTRKLAIKDGSDRWRKTYEMTPGRGVYIPFAAPHSVTNRNEVSISLSIIFNTEQTRKLQNIYRANHVLRTRFGRSPRVPGESVWRDAMKNNYFRAYDYSRHLMGIPGRAVRKLGRMTGLGKPPVAAGHYRR
ncbi:MAG: hypothetical protein MUC36_23280 [Planctomycetes bacterium]|jgi:hypothetical protein|nr:hypothetical protein [Planctomycetota bacterium]